MDDLYGGLGTGNQFLVIKTLDLDWIRIRIGIQLKMLDPDPYQMNTDPKHWPGTRFSDPD
jgi:hypothetical protein